jgi:hypothetical protein
MKVLFYKISIFVLFGMVSCSKDKTPSPKNQNDCQDFPITQGNASIPIFQYENYIAGPTFNPNNADEFVLQQINYTSQESRLIKYNLSTGSKEILLENMNKILSQPKWNKKGWITFNSYPDYNIWIVKDNGDSLTQLTNFEHCLYPVFNSSGKNIIFQYTPVLGVPYYTLSIDLETKIIDTLNNAFGTFNDVSENNILLSSIFVGQQNYLGTTSIYDIDFTPYVDLGLKSLEGLAWHPNNTKFHYTDYVDGGLKEFDITTGKLNILLNNCDSKRYTTISVSNDGKKMIASKVLGSLVYDSNGQFTNYIRYKSEICLINLATLNEEKINIE